MVVQDFESIAIIGRGAFGEVRVCRDKQTREVVAVKKMKKQDMIIKNQLVYIYTIVLYRVIFVLKETFQLVPIIPGLLI